MAPRQILICHSVLSPVSPLYYKGLGKAHTPIVLRIQSLPCACTREAFTLPQLYHKSAEKASSLPIFRACHFSAKNAQRKVCLFRPRRWRDYSRRRSRRGLGARPPPGADEGSAPKGLSGKKKGKAFRLDIIPLFILRVNISIPLTLANKKRYRVSDTFFVREAVSMQNSALS